MDALKEFLERAAEGKHQRVLFLLPSSRAIHEFKLELARLSDEMDLPVMHQVSQNWFLVHNSHAQMAPVHDGIARRFAGMYWTAIHGCDHLQDLKEPVLERAGLQATVRRHELDFS